MYALLAHALLVLAALSLAAWLYLSALHSHFWIPGPELRPEPHPHPCRVAIVIPARNEAEHLEATLRSLLAQQFPGDLHILVVDDNSTDSTGDLARTLAPHDARLHVVNGAPLPAGWTGKLWAVHQGLSTPEAQAADFVLLTDADITHAPHHLAQLVTKAQSENLDLVSEMVLLQSHTLPERLNIPAFVFFFCMLYPFRRVNDPRRALAAAAGGTVLLSRAALTRIDGVGPIRTELIDDCALAREVKRGGHAIWLGHANAAVSLRSYRTFAEIWQMIARTAYVQLRHSPLLLAGTCAGLLLLYALPVALAIAAHGLTRALAIATWALMTATYLPSIRRYRQNALWALTLPATALFYLAATIGSALNFHQGRGGRWKERTYTAPQ